MLKYKYIFQIKYTEAILSNSTRQLLWFEITKVLIASLRKKIIVSFIIIFGTLSFPIGDDEVLLSRVINSIVVAIMFPDSIIDMKL